MVNKLEDFVEPFNGNINSITEESLTQPFVIEKSSCSNFEDEKLEHKERMDFKYENCSDRYILTDADKDMFYRRQYFNYYRQRHEHFTPRIVENAKEIIGHDIHPVPLSGAKPYTEKFLVIGCLMKKMENRQAVLLDMEDLRYDKIDKKVRNLAALETLALDSDFVNIEDIQKQTIMIKGNIDNYDLVTGFVVGIYGQRNQIGSTFYVEKLIWPSLPPYIERPMIQEDVYVVFASGFEIRPDNFNMIREFNFFSQLFASEKYNNKIARMILAGNSSITFRHTQTILANVMPIGIPVEPDDRESALIASNSFRRHFPDIDIDIMPGDFDPCPLMLPQQPLDNVLLEDYNYPANEEEIEKKKTPKKKEKDIDSKIETLKVAANAKIENDAKDYWMVESAGLSKGHQRKLNPVTNPYVFKLMGTEIHGTSGQNVNGFKRLTRKGKSSLEIMKLLIESCHVVPTAPDYTDCFPFARKDGSDPLALDSFPHVFFAGNQKEFATEMADFGKDRKVRLISIPKYDETHEMVIMNLRTLEVSKIVSSTFL